MEDRRSKRKDRGQYRYCTVCHLEWDSKIGQKDLFVDCGCGVCHLAIINHQQKQTGHGTPVLTFSATSSPFNKHHPRSPPLSIWSPVIAAHRPAPGHGPPRNRRHDPPPWRNRLRPRQGLPLVARRHRSGEDVQHLAQRRRRQPVRPRLVPVLQRHYRRLAQGQRDSHI